MKDKDVQFTGSGGRGKSWSRRTCSDARLLLRRHKQQSARSRPVGYRQARLSAYALGVRSACWGASAGIVQCRETSVRAIRRRLSRLPANQKRVRCDWWPRRGGGADADYEPNYKPGVAPHSGDEALDAAFGRIAHELIAIVRKSVN
jgi:hypothetical protein